MKKSKRGICMADGGITQETPDQLMARMTAKYGAPAAGPIQPPVQQAPVAKQASQPQPAPQTTVSGQGILGILRGRKDVIDKASNYANGGIVRGKGTPTSDDVPVKVRGKQYNFSDTEAVLPSKTRQALGEMLGADAGDVAGANKRVEDFIEQTNGKPPVSVEEGTNLAAGGLLDEEARQVDYQRVTGVSAPSPIPAPAIAAPAVGISIGRSPAPTIYDNGGLPAPVVQRGIDTMRSQLAKPKTPAMTTPGSPVTTPAATIDDGYGGVYTPGGGALPPDKAGPGILSGVANFFKDSAEAARSGVHYDQIKAGRLSNDSSAPPVSQQAVSATAAPAGFAAQDPFGPKPDAMGIGKSTDGQFVTGKNGAMPDSSGGGFTQKGISYNVNPSEQEGIAKITSGKTNPLYTNIKPEDAVSGLKNQMVGGGAADVQEGLDRHARANAITQSIIDKQPMGGVGILSDGGIAADNAEKTARWRQDDLLSKVRNPAAGQVAASLAHSQGLADVESIRQQGILAGQNVQMRGQDIAAKSDAAKLAGNPNDNALKQAQTEGILAQADSAKMLADIQRKALAGDAQEAASYRALTGKAVDYKDRYTVVPGGDYIDPDNPMQKMRSKPQILDNATGKMLQTDGQPQGQKMGKPTYEQFAAQMKQRHGDKATEAAMKQVYAQQFGA